MATGGEGGAGAAEGEAYEAYLDAALRGEADAPSEFLARFPGTGPEERARIEALHRLALAGRRPRAPAGAAAEPGLPWERLGEFRLLRRIGSGGMGTVYEAEQPSLGRSVALKVIRADLRDSPEARERFDREARAAGRLRHPGIVSVHASGEQDGVRYLVLDLAPGRGLDEILDEARAAGAPIPPARAARWAARLARALEYAHARGVVHRDLKPSNVRVGPDDRPLLLDFGIARAGEAAGTLTGPFLGSPHYAAPEQITGRPVDGRADVWGLGATLYECLAGAPPFPGGSVDEVLHRALHGEPAPLRVRRPGIPRDLEAIVGKALEKEPARRYAGAREMAEDLEALLDFRPVRARPAGPWRRVRAFARARPALTAGAVTGAAALAALAGLLVHAAATRREEARRAAAAEVARARALLEGLGRDRDAAAETERALAILRDERESMYLPPERDRALEEGEDRLHALRRDREAAFHGALEALRQAERADRDAAGTGEVRAALYLERWRDAEAGGDAPAAEFYRGLAESHDPGGGITRHALGAVPVAFASDPPGAEVFLYRLVEHAGLRPGGEHRLVPVPIDGPGRLAGRGPPPEPGTEVLRVVRGAGELARGDLVAELAGFPVAGLLLVLRGAGEVETHARLAAVDGAPAADEGALEAVAAAGRRFTFERSGSAREVAAEGLAALGATVAGPRSAAETGGVPARWWGAEGWREGVLPAGLEVRATAAPLAIVAGGAAGRTPFGGVVLDRGSYLALFRAPGREEVRAHFLVAPGQPPLTVTVDLPAEGTAPAGFVRISRQVGPRGASCWFQERETTCAEYLAFLNDPAVNAAVPAAGPPGPAPRGAEALHRGHWPRAADGTFSLPAPWRPDWPVIGVSHDDAVAYAAWRTARAAAAGETGTFALPDFDEWLAAGGARDRFYSHGNRFRPKWVKSCFARPRAAPEPVLRFPRDESPLAIYDLAGSASEWLDAWYDRDRGLRRLAGGNWAYGKAEAFRLYGAAGWRPDRAGDEAGIRLVLRRPGDR
jgi:hypothetical protein